jgi:hypothetical protein
MLMPDKHISFSESLLGFGSYLLRTLQDSPQSLDALWSTYRGDLEAGRYSARQSFDTFLLAVVFLYSIGAIEELEEGVLGPCA